MQLTMGNSYSSVCDADCGLVPQIWGNHGSVQLECRPHCRDFFGALDDCESLRAGGGADAGSLLPGVRLLELACIN